MGLADDEITLRIEGEEIVLRPSLRAAFRLERRYAGFDQLLRQVADGSLHVLIDVVETCAEHPTFLRHDLDRFLDGGLVQIEALKLPIVTLIFGLAGIDPDAKDEDQEEQKNQAKDRISFAKHHEKLFRIATGWLGWTPSEAWNATPAEIMAAFEGRIELLTSIFGSSEKADTKSENVTLDDKLRLVMGGLGTRKVSRHAA